MVQLYSKVLEYQIRLMRQSSHTWALRYGRDVLKADEWKTMLSQIKELDSICSRLAGELGQGELEAGMKENNIKIDILLQSWNVGLQGLQEQGTNTYIAVDAHAKEDRSWRERQESRNLLQALRAKNPYRDQIERTPTRQPGTCNWFLNNPLFQTWRKDAHSRLLWVSANPGCGKSVLSKCLVEERLATLNPQSTTICYFFFKDVSPDSRSITRALSAILHQMFTKIPGLVEHAISAFDENGDELSSMFSTMWEILENAAADARAGEIVCVLDALDECEEAQQITLIEKLKTFYSEAEDSRVRKQKLRFLLTSRPYRKIRTQFHSLVRRFPTIHLSGDDESDLIKEEIDLVIHSEVSAIASERCFDSETEEFLLEQLLNIENRTYLWLHLILDQIRNSDNAGNKKAILKEIQTIPQSVSKAYEAILGKSKDKKLASKLLHIIVGAKTALTLQELNLAMSIDNDSRCYQDLELEGATAFELRIKNMCGLFVYTDQSKVFLIHQTAKEFLEWNQEVSEPPTGMWEHSLKPEESNSLLAGICIRLLMFDDFETDPLSDGRLDDHVTTVQYEQYCETHVFLKYAAEFWTEHLKSSPVEQQDAFLKRTADLCNVQSRRCLIWFRVKRFAKNYTQISGFTDLILASELGLAALVKNVLSKGIDVNATDDAGATALNRAVGHSNEDVVRILLDNGADIEAGDDWDEPWREDIDKNGSIREVKNFMGRPLMLATLDEDFGMMRILLAAGANLEARRRSAHDTKVSITALHAAILYGDDELTMRILLDHGADVNARSGQLEAQDKGVGNERFIRRRIFEMKGFQGGGVQATALQMAVWNDDAAKVRLLLDYGADPEKEVFFDEEEQEIESSSYHIDAVGESTSILVSPNDAQGKFEGPTPVEVFEHISTTDSDQAGLSRENNSFENKPVSEDEMKSLDQIESEYSPDEVGSRAESCFDDELPSVQNLEKWEQAVKAISKMTVLHVAASLGYPDVVRLLLQHGASKRSGLATPSEPTALHLAASLGHDQVVRMLLDQTVNVDPIDINGTTPLHLAVWSGNERVVNELLEHGVDANAKDNDGTTPLHVAVSMGYDMVVRDLLDYGADLHAENNAGFSPLLLAVQCGYDEAIKDFIHYGANLNAKNDHGITVLHMAALYGRDVVVKELLRHDVNLDAEDVHAQTSLHFAARHGFTPVVKELLVKGADVNARDINKDTSLHLAAYKGHDQVIKELLVYGAEPNVKGINEDTPLHLAALEGYNQVVKELLVHGAEPNAKGINKDTPLHVAAHKGHEQVVKELLVHGAEPNAKGINKDTPLHVAAREGHNQVVKELLDFDADASARNKHGNTPLQVAGGKGGQGQVAKQLLDRRANSSSIIIKT